MMIPTMETRPKHKARLPSDFVPGNHTVLCGRGKVCSASPGNKNLKNLVKSYLTPYSEAKNKIEKTAIVSSIVDAVRKEAPVGAFVRQEKNGEWFEVEDSFAREKIGCIFRDILHTKYRSSTKAKFARKKALKKSREAREKDNKNAATQDNLLLNGSNHSQSSFETSTHTITNSSSCSSQNFNSNPNMGLNPNMQRTVPSSMENGQRISNNDSLMNGPRTVFHGGNVRNQQAPYIENPSTTSCWKNAGGMMQFRPQPHFDLLKNIASTESLIRSDYRNKSAVSLLDDAFQIVGMPTDGMNDCDDILPDLPDDLSDIFEDNVNVF